MRARLQELEAEIQKRVDADDLARLFITIPGVSTLTAAAVIAETGNPSRFPNAAAFASYVGVVPRIHQSGKRKFSGNGAIPLGNARLRRALWMPSIPTTLFSSICSSALSSQPILARSEL